MGLGSPGFGTVNDDIANRIFVVVVGVEAVAAVEGEGDFDSGVGVGGQAVNAKVIAEKDGVTLVGAALQADVDVGWAKRRRGFEEPLGPLRGIGSAGGKMIAGDEGQTGAAGAGQRDLNGGIELGGGDLDVDDIFGSETLDGGGTDVVDAQCEFAQVVAQGSGELDKFGAPARLMGNDFDHMHLE